MADPATEETEPSTNGRYVADREQIDTAVALARRAVDEVLLAQESIGALAGEVSRSRGAQDRTHAIVVTLRDDFNEHKAEEARCYETLLREVRALSRGQNEVRAKVDSLHDGDDTGQHDLSRMPVALVASEAIRYKEERNELRAKVYDFEQAKAQAEREAKAAEAMAEAREEDEKREAAKLADAQKRDDKKWKVGLAIAIVMAVAGPFVTHGVHLLTSSTTPPTQTQPASSAGH